MPKNKICDGKAYLQFLLVLLFLTICLGLPAFPGTSHAGTMNIAVVKDGDSPFFDERIKEVIKELGQLTGTGSLVKIKELPQFNAQWETNRIPEVLNAALNDPETDIIYAAGFLVTEAAAQPDLILKKPVVAGAIHDGRFIGLVHDATGRSQKHNLTYIDIGQSIKQDIDAFYSLISFKRLDFLVDEKIARSSIHTAEYLRSIEKEKNIKIRIITAGTTADSVLNQLDKDVEAIYITPLVRMSPDESLAMINEINSRKIPSFALMGRPAVENGVLAGRLPEMELRMCRRIASNIQQVMMGKSPNNLRVTISLPLKMLLNVETANKIGFSPDFTFLISEAEIIGKQPEPSGPPLSLEQAMEVAAEANIDVEVQKEIVQSSLHSWEKARTYLRPQIYGNGQYLQIDADRAESAMGSTPERKTSIGAVIRQVIFDDKIFTGIDIGKLKYEENLAKQESVRLDVLERAGKTFLQCLSAMALYKIERDNLALTQKNLDLARVRQAVGYSGPEEVFRWEAEEAHRRSKVISAQQSVDLVFTALNQVLGKNQGIRWNPENIDIDKGHSYFLKGRFHNIVSNMNGLRKFMDFSIELAQKNAPETSILEKQKTVLELVLTQSKRKNYMPEIFVAGGYAYNIDKSGKGTELGLDIPGIDLPGPPDDHEWNVSLNVSLPIYEGGGRSADIEKTLADMKALENTKTRVDQLIEQRTRGALFNLSRSWPNIFLSKKATDRAGKNLELVQAMYSQGKVTITTLIDAQNSKLIQEQNSALAVYEYLSDLIEFQRAIAWFEYEKTSEQIDSMLEQIKKDIGGPL